MEVRDWRHTQIPQIYKYGDMLHKDSGIQSWAGCVWVQGLALASPWPQNGKNRFRKWMDTWRPRNFMLPFKIAQEHKLCYTKCNFTNLTKTNPHIESWCSSDVTSGRSKLILALHTPSIWWKGILDNNNITVGETVKEKRMAPKSLIGLNKYFELHYRKYTLMHMLDMDTCTCYCVACIIEGAIWSSVD